MSPTSALQRPGQETLDELAVASVAVRSAQKARDDLILRAIAEGHSERAIGRAAGVSGPAINQFKRRFWVRPE